MSSNPFVPTCDDEELGQSLLNMTIQYNNESRRSTHFDR